MVIRGAIGVVGDEDVFRFTNPGTSDVLARFEVWDQATGIGGTCGRDPVINIRNAAGARLAVDDDSGPGVCPILTFRLNAGATVYAHILQFADGSTIPGYILVATYLPAP